MAIAATCVWEIRTTGTAGNVNSGFFKTGASGTDFSQQNAAQYNLTGGATAGADAILLHASAAADMVGNGLHLISGVNATAGWYEILSVSVGVSITCDRAIATGVGATIVANIGGAISLGAANDDAVFESTEAGNIMYMQQGTYTLGGTVNIAKAGTAIPIFLEGYATTRGDRPLLTTRPKIVVGATTMTTGANWHVRNVQWSTTTTDTFVCITLGTANIFIDCYALHIGSTSDRAAYYSNADSILIRCQGVCALGRGAAFNGCNIGLRAAGTTLPHAVIGCLFYSNSVTALDFPSSSTAGNLVMNNTFYGDPTTIGVGISMASGCTDMRLVNNIFYGFTTGVTHASATQTIGIDLFNHYYNNDTNATNWTLGTGSITSVVSFANPGSGDFAVTSAADMGTGFPGVFPGGLTTGYMDIGAAQTVAASGEASKSMGQGIMNKS